MAAKGLCGQLTDQDKAIRNRSDRRTCVALSFWTSAREPSLNSGPGGNAGLSPRQAWLCRQLRSCPPTSQILPLPTQPRATLSGRDVRPPKPCPGSFPVQQSAVRMNLQTPGNLGMSFPRSTVNATELYGGYIHLVQYLGNFAIL